MKKIYYLLFTLLPFAACKKNVISTGNGCISQLKRLHFNITAADSTAAFQWLTLNHLPTNDLEVEYIIPHDTITINNVKHVYQYIYAVQYLNGFPILSGDFGYAFKEGVYTEVDGTRYDNINVDTNAKQSLPQVRSLFLDQVSKNAGANVAAALKNACLDAQFGYYDLNVRSTVPHHTPDFVMAWSITPKNKQFPQVLIRDNNGKLIVYYGDKI
jgi:hypothetical protein